MTKLLLKLHNDLLIPVRHKRLGVLKIIYFSTSVWATRFSNKVVTESLKTGGFTLELYCLSQKNMNGGGDEMKYLKIENITFPTTISKKRNYLLLNAINSGKILRS